MGERFTKEFYDRLGEQLGLILEQKWGHFIVNKLIFKKFTGLITTVHSIRD